MSNARCLLVSQFEYIDALLAFDDGPTWRSMVEILKQINSPVANVTLRPCTVLPSGESVHACCLLVSQFEYIDAALALAWPTMGKHGDRWSRYCGVSETMLVGPDCRGRSDCGAFNR